MSVTLPTVTNRRNSKPELEVESYLFEQATKAGYLAYKFVSPSVRGVPDRVLITPLGSFYIEVKRPGAKPRPDQIKHLKKIAAVGADRSFALYLDSKEAIDQLLEHIADDAITHRGLYHLYRP